MPRFAGIKNNSIIVLSDIEFSNENYPVVMVPEEMNNVDDKDLLMNYKFIDNKFVANNFRRPAAELRVAIVCNWKMQCGIATYSEFLYDKLIDKFKDYKFFIEKNDYPIGELNNINGRVLDENKFVSCWKRGEPLLDLVKAIKDYNPDVILIQHEFGIWPNARYWLSMMNQLSNYRIIITMHSVFHHRDKTICEAAMPEIVVHLDGAKKLLQEEKGLTAPTYTIPHGSFPVEDKTKLWNFYKTDHTLIQFGFGFEYKGYENSLKAVSILKKKYNDIFFTALFSESKQNLDIHNNYYNKLMGIVSDLEIQENVAIIKGFQSDKVLDSYLRTNSIALFPYVSSPGHEVYGASGAARFAMSKNIPIITSSIPHFSDLPTIKADTAEEIADKIDYLFNNNIAIQNQLAIQEEYLNNTSWEKIALMYVDVIEKSI